jgi:hypothetical protein
LETAPAEQPVTVYYERSPDGTIRQVSSSSTQSATEKKKAEPVAKPAVTVTKPQEGASAAQSSVEQPVTVYYERLPDGTIRQVSTSAGQTAIDQTTKPVVKPSAVVPTGLQYSTPLPQIEVKTKAISTVAPPTSTMRIDDQVVPMQREVIPTAPAPVMMPPVTDSYNRVERGIATSIMPLPATPMANQVISAAPIPVTMPPVPAATIANQSMTVAPIPVMVQPVPAATSASPPMNAALIPVTVPAPVAPVSKPLMMEQPAVLPDLPPASTAPVLQPVMMQQPAVLPGLPPLNEPTAAATIQPPVVAPSAPAETPVVPKIVQPPASPMPTASQPPPAPSEPERSETLKDYNIETEPPTLARLYRLDSEAQLKARIADEIRNRPKHGEREVVSFPPYHPLTDEKYEPRQLGGLIKQIEPNYLVHGRLYCEELNSERYGWDLGIVQPFVSTAVALKDFALFPYNFGTRPCQRFESSAGKCYPGDPVPYLLYPPELSLPGGALEAGVILAAFALVP